MEIFDLVQEYGPYCAHPIIVAGVVQGLKAGFKKFFKHHEVGIRLLPFLPIILGLVGGLLLPVESMKEQLLLGGALGQLSSLIYKFFSTSIASKTKLAKKQAYHKELEE